MAQIPQIQLLKVDEFPALTAASKGELEKLFRVLNTALSAIGAAVGGQLVIGENVRGFQKTLTLRSTDIPGFAFQNAMGVRPSSVAIASAYEVAGKALTPVALPGVAWMLDKDQITIQALGTLDPAKQYQVTFEVRG